jgi:dipeptidyl aminopeptidase/acylaminoacyl peptidase
MKRRIVLTIKSPNGKRVRTFFACCLSALAVFAFSTQVEASTTALWKAESESPVVTQNVSFDNQGAHLQGTLYLRAKGDHLPALVVFHGASAPTREYAMYRHLSQGLPALGYAVLVFDRRGSGASTGSLEQTDYQQLADDGIAGLHAIAGNPRIDAHRIGFWGHSQGGWLAVLAASRTHDAAFAISVSAPMVTPSEQMTFAVANMLTLHGQEDAVAAATDARKRWEGYLRGTNSRDDAIAALAAIEHKPWFSSTFMSTAEEVPVDVAQSSWRREMDLDPLIALKQVDVPVLFFFGGADPWVPAAASRTKLNALAQTRQGIETHVIDGANHAMAYNPHEKMEFDKSAIVVEHPEAPEYFFLLANWLNQHAR